MTENTLPRPRGRDFTKFEDPPTNPKIQMKRSEFRLTTFILHNLINLPNFNAMHTNSKNDEKLVGKNVWNYISRDGLPI